MSSISAENSRLSPGLTLVDSLRQRLGETHIFRAFFSDLSHDVLPRYSPGTHWDRSRTGIWKPYWASLLFQARRSPVPCRQREGLGLALANVGTQPSSGPLKFLAGHSMSAIPPKADIPHRDEQVRFVPIADIVPRTSRKSNPLSPLSY